MPFEELPRPVELAVPVPARSGAEARPLPVKAGGAGPPAGRKSEARARPYAGAGSSQSRISGPRTTPNSVENSLAISAWNGVPGRLHSATTKRCEKGELTALVWDRETGDVRVSQGYCKGYRCRVCGSLVAKQLRDRITVAVESRRWWLYLVLTFDPKDFDSSWDAYLRAGKLWHDVLRKRIAREFGRFEYVQTWERHVGGKQFPHLNLILTGPELREAAIEAGIEDRFYDGAGHGRGRVCRFTHLRKWFAHAVPQCGFGKRVWVEVLDAENSIAAYLAKAAQDLSSARWKAGDQTTIGAPPHFRRVRASRGLLPPLPEAEFDTGLLVPLHPEAIPHVPHEVTGEAIVDPAFVARVQLEQADARRRREPKEPRFETGLEWQEDAG